MGSEAIENDVKKLDALFVEAERIMLDKISKEYGNDASKWPNDITEYVRTYMTAVHMHRDICVVLIKNGFNGEDAINEQSKRTS